MKPIAVEHDALREGIPSYVLGRLDADERAAMAAHLAICETCAEIEETCRHIVAASQGPGDVVFEPHPGVVELRDYVTAGGAGATSRIERHLEHCPTCQLELDAWRRQALPSGTAERMGNLAPVARARLLTIAGIGLAAGLLVGVGLGLLFRGRQDERSWSGLVPVYSLPAPARGASEVPKFPAEHVAPIVTLAVHFGPTVVELRGERCRFDVLDDAGRVIWSTEIAVDAVRRQVDAVDAVTLAVPSALLGPGAYEIRLRPASGILADEVRLRVRFEVVPPV